MAGSLLDVEQAQAKLLRLAGTTARETVASRAALGRYCAADVQARLTRPAADLSAMDGFAVAGAGPWILVGESRCGAPFGRDLGPQEAVHISTGALVPESADAIVIKENAVLAGTALSSTQPPVVGRHIRRKGFDFAPGDHLLRKGERIGPAQLALLLAGGHGEIAVWQRPTLTILECGDELTAVAGAAERSHIPATNGAMLAALCAGEACEVDTPPPLADDLAEIGAALDQANDSQLVVISGGASVGDHDLVRPALTALGAQIAFWKVAMKPGKPLMVATRDTQVILGLPGNPVSCFVTGFLFMLPAIRTLLGCADPLPRRISLPTRGDLSAVGNRREFLRARITADGVTPFAQQDSSALLSLAAADCLIERPAGCAGIKAGTPVPAYPLQNGGIA